MSKVEKSDAQWREQLSEAAYRVTRQSATEPAFSGYYEDVETPGVYRCICCGEALFDAATKFHSGSGWPSFYQPVRKDAVAERSDTSLGMTRTEALCPHCDAHLGHVFPDGPEPTGLRYCINSVALELDPEE